ncbi:putative heat-shock protein, Hsp20 family [Leptospira ryugenii]|uniref:Putative heat-shock protein, Hsp20 family n=1 Tax=Leptospira ryugenii TaxID=1917863 RepID=A0A2P2DX71_9LEPT|nr:Hsp20/alpha crystallin family protein [Leptospira ryugenii]GBF49234.1 putative heat-shock protein, Hsp20 family [Leptospira ryugenii]
MTALTNQNTNSTATVEQTKKEEKVYSPNVNIYETKENFILIVEMPGIDQSSVEVSVEKDVLSIEGNVQFDHSHGEEASLVEFRGGRYARKFTIGKFVDVENAQAKMKQGILELTLPKIEPKKTKITIQS